MANASKRIVLPCYHSILWIYPMTLLNLFEIAQSSKAWSSMSEYANYNANLAVLRRAHEQDLGNEFIRCGIVDKFAMQFELSWKLLRRTLEHEGRLDTATGSPRGIIKTAYSAYDFIDEDLWLAMLADRNAAEHVYSSELAMRLVNSILSRYIAAFEDLLAHLEALYDKDLLDSF